VNTPLFSSPYTTGATVVPPYPGGPGCTGPGNVCPDLRPFQKTGPEKLTDVEIGSKTDFTVMGVHARFDIDAYWEKYNDALQFFNVLGTGIYTGAPDLPNDQSVGINAADETIEGLEAGLTVKPVDSITAPPAAGFSLTKSEITLPSPLFAGSASFAYEPDFQVAGGNIVFSGDWFQTSHFAAQYGVDFKGYGVGNMRLALNNIEGKGIDVAVFAKNIADRAYLIAPVVLLQSFPDSTAVYAPPRQYGVELRYNF
jgi:iron complex outermembrane receptor protein